MLAHPLGAHADRDVEVRGCAAARRQRRRRRHLRPDGAGPARGPRQRVPAARARHRRRRVLLRRCRDHARDLGAFGSRGPQARRSRPSGSSCPSRSWSSSACSCCSRTARRASRASSARSPWSGSWRWPAGDWPTSSTTPGLPGHQSLLRDRVRRLAWSRGAHRARPHFPGGDGRGGALRGPRPFRAQADPDRLAGARVSGAGAQLSRPGRARARPPRRDREPVLQALPGMGADADGGAGHPRHGDRQPGGHYGRLLADEPGDPARAAPAFRRQAHLGGDGARSICRASTGCCSLPSCSS